jgi:hypothetical protein
MEIYRRFMYESNKVCITYNFLYVMLVFWGAEWSVLRTQYRAGDKIENNEMGGACSTYGGGESCVQGFGGETWGKETAGETQA